MTQILITDIDRLEKIITTNIYLEERILGTRKRVKTVQKDRDPLEYYLRIRQAEGAILPSYSLLSSNGEKCKSEHFYSSVFCKS